ncbi:MAG: TPM domain-containing protein [Alphaproteobacteria bacterium]|nr:TPM domain-containing protein [Alphaproteobacteria bacterium]
MHVVLWAIGSLATAAVPTLVDPVTDEANVLEPSEERALDGRIRALREKTGVQAAVLTVATTAPLGLEEYSLGVVDAWGGGGERDDGLLVLLVVNDRRTRIEVGYGLEGYVTDGEAAQLLEGAVPHLREKRYHAALDGVLAGLDAELDGLEPDMGIPIGRRAVGWLDRLVPQGIAGAWAVGWLALLAVAVLAVPRVLGYPRVRAVGTTGAVLLTGLAGAVVVGVLGLSALWSPLWGVLCGGLLAWPIAAAKKPVHALWGFAMAVLSWVVIGVPAIGADDALAGGILMAVFGLTGMFVVLVASFIWWDVPEGYDPSRAGSGRSYGSGSSSGSSSYSDSSGSSGSSSSSDSSSSGSGGDWGGGGGGFGGGGASGSW